MTVGAPAVPEHPADGRWPPVGSVVRGRADQSFAAHEPMLVLDWATWDRLAKARTVLTDSALGRAACTPVVWRGDVHVVERRDLEVQPVLAEYLQVVERLQARRDQPDGPEDDALVEQADRLWKGFSPGERAAVDTFISFRARTA